MKGEKKMILIGVIVIVVIVLLIVWMVGGFGQMMPIGGFFMNKEKAPEKADVGEIRMMLFYADWCPHCQHAKPIWNSIKMKYAGNKKIRGLRVVFEEVDCSDKTIPNPTAVEFGVKGYPTIVAIKGGELYRFGDTPVTENHLDIFIDEVANG